MRIVDINALSVNERAVDYIKDIDIEVIMSDGFFRANIVVEQKAHGQPDIKVTLLEDVKYPEDEVKKLVKKHIRQNMSMVNAWKK